ncbi:methylcobamide:CoM methyltransferase MtbA [Methanococcus maripaludis]|jgi:[methyl-Co(III) methanol-specific corrinoid protein]:coenzyme M methyltransferase|uniref:Methylcobamide:CoM methyltransferase n=2 Tax=Methanococcus maripaludis TaxID=39152 RepID=A0A2Z5PVJ8_METMI|nr:methylcobamide:CoM methyltransferase MtbA [Methanococcus maripaludis]BAP61034.1 methylcobamide:CoM methyltransferase [Methanococcus maripaludis KA1]BAP62981.1 methylcobamide:CoM methyltransferase [Methanococcus maripaludis OS7]
MITPKERLSKTLKGEKVDRIPCICPGGMMNMITKDIMDITGVYWPEAHTDAEKMAKLTIGMYENGGFENYGVPFCMTVEAEAFGAGVKMGTDITEPRVTNYPIDSVTEYEKLNHININEGRGKTVLESIELLKEKNTEVPIIANLTGPVSTASSLMEPVTYYKELRRKPEAAKEFMDFVTENLIEFGKAQLKAGADVLAISDPSGTGEILGPKMFKEFAVPYLNKIIEETSDLAETGTIIHICGRLKSVYAEINSLKSDAISFDSITDVGQVVENVSGKAIMGNVSTFALENGTPDSIDKMSKACIKFGVDILSPACGIGVRTKLENIQAMVQACKNSKRGE